jgi:dTMP kinase
MFQNTGSFLVVEGTGGSDKQRQTRLRRLVERLQNDGHDVRYFDFPLFAAPASYFVQQYKDGLYGSGEEVGPYTAALFYALDRYEASRHIRTALEDGAVVVASGFTSVNMVQQGAKFNHSEERRGFYIWLDNLEFQMLHLPRPTKTIVLRTNSQEAEKLDSSDDNNETNEAYGLSSKSIELYDELITLFPKDFQSIDCIRDKSLMSEEQIHNQLYKTIEPYLPEISSIESKAKRSSGKTTILQSSFQEINKQNDDFQAGDGNNYNFNTSYLLAGKLGSSMSAQNVRSYDNSLGFIIPANIDKSTKAQYIETMNTITDAHTELVQKIKDHSTANTTQLGDRQEELAFETAALVLPLAVISTFKCNKSDAEALQRLLQNEPLLESKEVLRDLLKLAGDKEQHSAPQNSATEFTTDLQCDSIDKIVASLPETHSGTPHEVQLISHWPKNEIHLLPDILYPYSALPYKELEQNIATWSIDKKYRALEAFTSSSPLKNTQASTLLSAVQYRWDIVCTYDTYYKLQTDYSTTRISVQAATPRYGYEIPKIIEDAGAGDLFEACFDASLKLYSALQAAGYQSEASYATLLGHKNHCFVTFSASDLAGALKQSKTGEIAELINEMMGRVSEVHPLLSSLSSDKS